MSDDTPQYEHPSKSQRKRDMTALQTIGQRLIKLNPAQLKALDLPEGLLDAVVLAQRLPKHEALRRQMQYIGRMMRVADEELVARITRYLEALNR